MTLVRKIEVLYKCTCCEDERAVPILARLPDEDLDFWMHHVCAASIYLHHREYSPTCGAQKMTYIRIPYNSDQPVGAPDTLNA
jgi:hypothetical protein